MMIKSPAKTANITGLSCFRFMNGSFIIVQGCSAKGNSIAEKKEIFAMDDLSPKISYNKAVRELLFQNNLLNKEESSHGRFPGKL